MSDKIVSKWLPANSVFWEENSILEEPEYVDPILAKIKAENGGENFTEKTTTEFNPIDLDEVFSVNPANQKLFKGYSTVRFKNGYSCLVDVDVHTIYEKLLAREEYVEKRRSALIKIAEKI